MTRQRLGRRQKAILDRLDHGDWVKGRALADDVGGLPAIMFTSINRLRARGFEIEGHQQRGYRLARRTAA